MSTLAYRRDIDSLRAIAVIAVIIFHYGYLPNGYLGVDIFFVISGYIITTLMIKEIHEESFSLKDFYLRRIRRIIPLTTVVILVVLAAGFTTMLPDDLENLAESVVATNFFANNILQAITTRNYWDVVNEYKPLMHTWSLGIEEQFYLIYPIIIYHLTKKGAHRTNLAIVAIILLTLISVLLYLGPYKDYVKFYYIPFRFWELSMGALAAFMSFRLNHGGKWISILLTITILGILGTDIKHNRELILLATTLLAASILTARNHKNNLLENNYLSFIGRISFGLYMWHQPALAFSRYLWKQSLTTIDLGIISLGILILAIITYHGIEKPFRNKRLMSTPLLTGILTSLFVLTTIFSLYLYQSSGVLRDIPELEIDSNHIIRNMHQKYNHRNYERNRMFVDDERLKKVMVIGNSFARDWINVLLESEHATKLDIIYVNTPENEPHFTEKKQAADIIFCSECTRASTEALALDLSKTWVVGTKNFGTSNGIYFNKRGSDPTAQRTRMEDQYYELNRQLEKDWGDKYLDYIAIVIDSKSTMPVYTPEGKFISQDTRHLTQAGAKYFASLFNKKLSGMLTNKQTR
jgi:peptidoglycan/LPS O-acetylase OafA/YrhL